LNWEAFVTPTELSLGFASVSLPLGLLLLSLLVLLTVIFLVHAVYLQGTVLLDTRRHSRRSCKPTASWPTRPRPHASPPCSEFICGRAGPPGDARQTDAQQALLARIAELEQASRRPSPSKLAIRSPRASASWKIGLERGLPAPRR
jgi:hypothetical protein